MVKYKRAVGHAVKACGHLTDALGDITKRIYPLSRERSKGKETLYVEVDESTKARLEDAAFKIFAGWKAVNANWKDNDNIADLLLLFVDNSLNDYVDEQLDYLRLRFHEQNGEQR